jgi:hypothetical protein
VCELCMKAATLIVVVTVTSCSGWLPILQYLTPVTAVLSSKVQFLS